MVDLESLTILARPRHDSFNISAVEYPRSLKPQSTFQVTFPMFNLSVGQWESRTEV